MFEDVEYDTDLDNSKCEGCSEYKHLLQIGSYVLVNGGVTISHGAVIFAGDSVVKDTPLIRYCQWYASKDYSLSV